MDTIYRAARKAVGLPKFEKREHGWETPGTAQAGAHAMLEAEANHIRIAWEKGKSYGGMEPPKSVQK